MVENMGDDLWIGVKGQANSVIAGSPRNVFRYSVRCLASEVEHWMGNGASPLTDLNQTPNAGAYKSGSETTGDELRWSKGKQPRPPAKAPNSWLSGKRCGIAKTARRLAQKQPPFKECVIAHWSSDPARTM